NFEGLVAGSHGPRFREAVSEPADFGSRRFGGERSAQTLEFSLERRYIESRRSGWSRACAAGTINWTLCCSARSDGQSQEQPHDENQQPSPLHPHPSQPDFTLHEVPTVTRPGVPVEEQERCRSVPS